MGNYQHIWILRRIFGNQPVGCVSRPSWPKAGFAAQVIRASSSDWTFRGPSVVHCRLGKSDDRGYRASYYSTATVEAFQPYSTPPVSRNSPQPPPQTTPRLPKAQQLSGRPLRYYRAAKSSANLPFQMETARNTNVHTQLSTARR